MTFVETVFSRSGSQFRVSLVSRQAMGSEAAEGPAGLPSPRTALSRLHAAGQLQEAARSQVTLEPAHAGDARNPRNSSASECGAEYTDTCLTWSDVTVTPRAPAGGDQAVRGGSERRGRRPAGARCWAREADTRGQPVRSRPSRAGRARDRGSTRGPGRPRPQGRRPLAAAARRVLTHAARTASRART